MFISHVDTSLEDLIRSRLPLSTEVGDVSFDPPTKDWAAQLTRITVSVFLYDVQRSTQTSRAAMRLPAAENGTNGAGLRRRPQPMVQLSYLISAWAGGPRDEHQLLGDLTSLLSGLDVVPSDVASSDLASSIQLALGDDRNLGRDLWQAVGGALRPAVQLRATVAADTFAWEQPAPSVERIRAMADRMDRR